MRHQEGNTQSSAEAPSISLPCRLGEYELLAELGRGGMGVIYKARQTSLDRLCAVKMLKGPAAETGAHSEDALQFEANAAASLDHPNIVGIYEAGRDQGRLYFSMEYIPGENLELFSRTRMLDAEAVARLIRTVAGAISYAHRRGVMHHDLKPANIIIDPAGEPQITDFGLARRVDFERRADPTMAAGSPNYMSPEQASGRFGDPDLRTDVWGLGAILYFLLMDRPPFRGETVHDTVQAVLTLEPVAPRTLRPGVPIDLETICLKCLEKTPARRYATVAEVWEELTAFLEHRPIHARPAGAVERTRKWCRRHPAIAALGSVVVILLVLISLGSSVATYRVRTALQRAEANHAEAQRSLYAADMLLAGESFATGNDARVRQLVERHAPARGEPDLRGWEWRFLAQGSRGDRQAVLGHHGGWITQIATTRDGRYVVSADESGQLKTWDISKKAELASRNVRQVGSAAFDIAPDSRWLLTSQRQTNGTDSVALVLSLPELRTVREIPFAGGAFGLSVTPDSQYAWLVDFNEVRRISLASGQVSHRIPVSAPGRLRDFAISHDAALLAIGDEAGRINLWELPTGKKRGEFPGHKGSAVWGSAVNGLVFSPDDRALASCGSDGLVHLWDPAGLRKLRTITGHSDLVVSVCFSPDGSRLVSAGKDSFIQVTDLSTPASVPDVLRGAESLQIAAAFLADNRTPISGGVDGALQVWNARPNPAVTVYSNLPPRTAFVTPFEGGTAYATYTPDWGGTLRDLRTHEELHHVSGATNRISMYWQQLADGRFAELTLGENATLSMRLLPAGPVSSVQEVLKSKSIRFALPALDLSPDGKTAVASDMLNGIRIYDAPALRLRAQVPAHPRLMVLSRDAKWIACEESQGRIRLINARDGSIRPAGMEHQQVAQLQFAADSRQLASAGHDGVLRIWDVPSGREILRLNSSAGALLSVAWAPDGTRIFGGSLSGFISAWDPATGVETFVQRAHLQPVTGLAILPDQTLVSFGPDAVRQWRAPVLDLRGKKRESSGQGDFPARVN